MFFDLQSFIVGKLNNVGDWLEERLIYMDLGIGVDGVVPDVKELCYFWLWKLLYDAFA